LHSEIAGRRKTKQTTAATNETDRQTNEKQKQTNKQINIQCRAYLENVHENISRSLQCPMQTKVSKTYLSIETIPTKPNMPTTRFSHKFQNTLLHAQ